MSAADSRPRTRTDGVVAERRLVTFSLGSDSESAVVRAWLQSSADQGDESRRIRQALAAGLQLVPHLEHIAAHLAVLTRIEAHLNDAACNSAAQTPREDSLTHAEEAALAALLDTD